MLNDRERRSDSMDAIQYFPGINNLREELHTGLDLYFRLSEKILLACGVHLKPPQEDDFSLKKNFFSFLFLYSYFRANIPKARRILYVASIQCLRGMVTGCDNLLDDEYKKTLDTDLPENGYKIRSVLDIMISDRVLFQVVDDLCRQHGFSHEKIMAASAASMKTITQSGIQEASEEGGITTILAPEVLLNTVHHYKTGILFTCPWDIPMAVEDEINGNVPGLKEGLYKIGMGCQILDDIVDIASDISQKRHNYMVSVVRHGTNPVEQAKMARILKEPETHGWEKNINEDFAEGRDTACKTAERLLNDGFSELFAIDHQALIPPCIEFIFQRIGVSHLNGK